MRALSKDLSELMTSQVIAGLDHAIHRLRPFDEGWMDTRVQPAYGAECVAASCGKLPNSNFKQPRLRVLTPPRELGFS